MLYIIFIVLTLIGSFLVFKRAPDNQIGYAILVLISSNILILLIFSMISWYAFPIQTFEKETTKTVSLQPLNSETLNGREYYVARDNNGKYVYVTAKKDDDGTLKMYPQTLDGSFKPVIVEDEEEKPYYEWVEVQPLTEKRSDISWLTPFDMRQNPGWWDLQSHVKNNEITFHVPVKSVNYFQTSTTEDSEK